MSGKQRTLSVKQMVLRGIQIFLSRRLYPLRLALVFAALFAFVLHTLGYSYWPSWYDEYRSRSCHISPDDGTPDHLTRVGVLESIGVHDEVTAALVHAFGGHSDVQLTLYSARQRYNMDKIMNNFTLSADYTLSSNVYAFTRMARQCPPPHVVVSSSCELDFDNTWATAALTHLYNNGVTKLFCVFHHADWWREGRHVERIRKWQEQGRVEFIGLSQHTVDSLINETSTNFGWTIKAHAFPPVFPVEHAELKPASGVLLSLQGDYSAKRRNYGEIFDELDSVIKKAEDTPGTRDVSLHLIGHGSKPTVPHALQDHVVFDEGVSYPDFYAILGQSFAVIPAFASDEYLTQKASSTVPASLIAGAPLIATEEMLASYSYLSRDAVWLSKAGETEMDTIKRAIGSWDTFLEKRKQIRAVVTKLLMENRANVKKWLEETLKKKSKSS